MKKIAYILAVLTAGGCFTGCSDSVNESTGIGRLMLNAEISPELKLSRAIESQELQKLSDECLIWISNEKGLVREYVGINNVPADGIWLTGGHYVAAAWAGDSVPASFTQRYFKGSVPFEIASGNVDKIDLVCSIANVGVSVQYNVTEEVLHDCVLTVGHSVGSLTWTGNDNKRGYFMMNSRDKSLQYTLTGIDEKGEDFTASGILKDVQGGIEYCLVVNHNSINVDQGGVAFKIEIEESPMAIEKVITIDSAPLVLGREDNLDIIQSAEPGSFSDLGMYIVATNDLESVVVDFSEIKNYIGFPYDDVDIIKLHKEENQSSTTDELHELLENIGFDHVYVDPVDETSGDDVLLVFKKRMLDKLPVGNYEITVTATDSKGKIGTGVLKIKVTDAVTQAEPIVENSPAVWATQATLTGSVLKDTETAGFKYREKGTETWAYVEGKATSRAFSKGVKYNAVLTGLKPGTTYEYIAVASEFESAEINEFTTEDARQLPNSGFEDWNISKTPYLIYSEDPMFWDSGNHGSATMSKNVTEPDEAIKHSGRYSIKLASQFVGVGSLGKFAAGNVFIGEYLETKGTNGVLGWGRSWNSRPKQLKGYVRYTPVAITHESTANGYKKGDMDTGIIYVALLDGSKKQGNATYPVVIDTSVPKLFNENGDDVIAYGKIEFTAATAGSGMVEFTIDLDYRRTDIKPSYIMCTASASKGGDYFAGGNGSVMYLDDLELVY